MFLNEEHKLLVKTVSELVEMQIRPRAREIDRGWYPRELIRRLGELGLIAPTLPPEYGGASADTLSQVLVVELIARASPGLATIVEIQGSMIAHNIYRLGNRKQKEELLPKFASGELVASFALSEPCCGSDAAAIETRAERVGGVWRINGVKLWITSGMYADYFLLFARTGRKEERHRAITAFLIRRNGCIETTPIELMGLGGTGTAEVRLNDCEASDDDVVGEVNGGWKVAMNGINLGRLNVGAIGLGIAEEALREAYEYAQKREAFGKKLAEFQAVQHHLAEMYIKTEALRSLVYTAAVMHDSGDPRFIAYAQAAKVLGSRTAVENARLAMQIMGGYGYSKDAHVEMLYRDAKVTEIYEGANEVVLNALYKFITP